MYLQIKDVMGIKMVMSMHLLTQGGAIEDNDFQTGNIAFDNQGVPIKDNWLWNGDNVEGATNGTVERCYKIHKINEIDDRSKELIGMGFDYGTPTVTYSMSDDDQKNALSYRIKQVSGQDMTGYPWRNNGVTYNFASDADFTAWYDAGMTRINAVLDGGWTLKDSVLAAANTQAAMDAIVDNRT